MPLFMHTLTPIILVAILCLGHASAQKETIPYPDALDEARVQPAALSNAQSQALMVGNGDLYGILWDVGSQPHMRLTKNDIWDARVDTSRDGPLPKVNVATREITGSKGAQASYDKPYPQPRSAIALGFKSQDLINQHNWTCIRTTDLYSLAPGKEKGSAVMQVGNKAGASSGYQKNLPTPIVASAVKLHLKGSENAKYYIEVHNSRGHVITNTGWQKSPTTAQDIELKFAKQAVLRILIYTMTATNEMAENTIQSVQLTGGEEAAPIAQINLPTQAIGINKGELDLKKAVVSLGPNKVRVLAQKNVCLLDTPDEVTLVEVKSSSLPPAETGETDGIKWLLMKMPGDIDYKGMTYAVALAAKGNLKAVSIVTSWDLKSDDVLAPAIKLAKEAANGSQEKQIAEHELAWSKYWSCSGITLADKTMQNWWYRMLYFAKTVHQPGASPVGLMPPLATDATPWHADFHFNYNTWQAFWPLPAANHGELADPWISYIHDNLPRFRNLAKVTFDCDGIFFPISSFLHEPDPKDSKSRHQRQVSFNPWGLTIGMVGMAVQNGWQKHLCDPDPVYLREKIYPIIQGGAQFYVSFMSKCKIVDGKVRLGPSFSPEHGAAGIDNCPFDIAYVNYTFNALIQAAGELKVDAELVAQCKKYQALLPDYPTALNAQKETVVVDWLGCAINEVPLHNITVPSAPVFPADQVTWFSSDAEKDLMRRTIKATRHNGNNSHVMFNIAKARLSMPEAVTDFKGWFQTRELPNGLFVWTGHAHGTFMPEMIGIAGVIDEFLLQSVQNKIRLFPSWPADQDAGFKGLRAQGGFLVSADLAKGVIQNVSITSTDGQELQILSPWKTIQVNGKPAPLNKDGLLVIPTSKGEIYLLTAGD